MMSHFEEQTKMLEKRLTRLEHGAWKPRLAMEADGHANTKTQERTEGAATAVQAMRGDSCTTEQKVQDGPKPSISFGMMAELPDLPRREDVLIEEGATSPESCLPSLEMRLSTAAGGLVPTGEVSTATETRLQRKIHGLQFHPPRTTAASSRRETCLLFPTAGGSWSLTQNPGEIGL